MANSAVKERNKAARKHWGHGPGTVAQRKRAGMKARPTASSSKNTRAKRKGTK